MKLLIFYADIFSNIGEQLASAIPNVNKSPLDNMATSPTESFYVFPATS